MTGSASEPGIQKHSLSPPLDGPGMTVIWLTNPNPVRLFG